MRARALEGIIMAFFIIALSVTALFTLAYFSPIIARKLFPTPPEAGETTITVSFPHLLQAGQKLQVDNEVLEVVRVNGSQITVKAAASES
jgi:hypothetical protein